MVAKKKDSDTKATVTKTKAKQDELPGVTVSDRKIQELEDLGDALVDAQDEATAAREKVKDCDENLTAAMKRRERTYYSRTTWGSITLKESHTKSVVKKASSTADVGDSEEIE